MSCEQCKRWRQLLCHVLSEEPGKKGLPIPPFEWPRFKGSLLVYLAVWVHWFLNLVSPMRCLECVFARCERRPRAFVVEAWVLFKLGLEASCLLLARPGYSWPLFVAVYALIEVVGALLRDVVISPSWHRDEHGSFVMIQDVPRWLIMAVLNILEVILCFSIVLLCYGKQFTPMISDPVTALYQSMLTFTTLGYGDFTPTTAAAKIVICLELMFFLLFLAAKLPVAVSSFRFKEKH